MWTKVILEGTNFHHLIASFVIYSMLGWLVESIYMSICNRKLTNRGFAKVPFCPIYGFGAVLGYLILSPLRGNVVQLYIVGAVLATIFEFLVGMMMIRVLGQLWWDYNEKPFNYKGIICLESTVAWGFYAVIIVLFLHKRVIGFIDRYDAAMWMRLCSIILFIVAIDYMMRFKEIFNLSWENQKKWINDKYTYIKTKSEDWMK